MSATPMEMSEEGRGNITAPTTTTPSPYLSVPSTSASSLNQPRVGSQYQVNDLPQPTTVAARAGTSTMAMPANSATVTTSTTTANSGSDPSIEGTPVWLGSRYRDAARMDGYLRSVDALFYGSSEHYDEEKALELLHRCNYDTAAALEMLQPWAKVDDLGEEGEASKPPDSDDMCSVCGDGGDLIICDAKGCKRVYHAVCAELSEVPSGMWECSVHFCATCGQRVNDANSVRCSACPTSFCATHIPAYARSANQIKHVDFKCPKCAGSRENSNSDRRGFLTQLIAALNGEHVPQTGKPAEYHTAPINLKELYREITVRGGLEEVLTTSNWREIQRLYFHPISQSKPHRVA